MTSRQDAEIEGKAKAMLSRLSDQATERNRELLKGFVRAHTRGRGGKLSQIPGYWRKDGPTQDAMEPRLPMSETPEEKREERIRKIEEGLAGRPREILVVYGEDGRPLWAREGEADFVPVGDKNVEALEGLADAGAAYGLTHNHPSGHSLSIPDLRLACSTRLKEIRAVGLDWVYRIQSPRGRFTHSDRDILLTAAHIADRAVRNFQTVQIHRDELTPDEASMRHHHLLWQNVAEKYPQLLSYQRMEREKPEASHAA